MCCFFFPLPLPLPVYSISSVHIPKVCMDVWPVVCLLPETRINTEQATRQSILREAGSINISYVQLSQTVRTVDCINWSHRFRMEHKLLSPCYSSSHWSYKCVNCFYICIEWMCLLFLYQCQTDEEEEPWAPRLHYWSVTGIYLTFSG